MSHAAALPALAIAAGVALGTLASVPVLPLLPLLALGWSGAVVAYRAGSLRSDLHADAVTVALVVGFLSAGALLGAEAVSRTRRPSLRHLFDQQFGDVGRSPDPVVLEGRVRRDAAPTTYGAAFILDVERVVIHRRTHAAAGGVRLSVGGRLHQGRVHRWRAGRTLRLVASLRVPARYLSPGVGDREASQASRGVSLLGSVKSGALVEVVARGSPPAETAAWLRAAIRRSIESSVGVWSSTSAGIVTAILIGDRAGLPLEVSARLREAGTYHVIAISGGNVAILAGILLGVLGLVGMPPRAAATLAMLGLTGYAYLVGGEPSVVRATLVALIYLAARLGDHRTPPLNAVAVAGALGLCARPLSLHDVGFALTFGATLAILLGCGRLTAWLSRALGLARVPPRVEAWLRMPVTLLAATVCAELALFPIGAYAFSESSPFLESPSGMGETPRL